MCSGTSVVIQLVGGTVEEFVSIFALQVHNNFFKYSVNANRVIQQCH